MAHGLSQSFWQGRAGESTTAPLLMHAKRKKEPLSVPIQGRIAQPAHLEDLGRAAAADALQLGVAHAAHHHRVLVLPHAPHPLLLLLRCRCRCLTWLLLLGRLGRGRRRLLGWMRQWLRSKLRCSRGGRLPLRSW